ncbi:TenA family protein [Mobilicoccus massiliensis]|uniref:TenA family protein n=1 Tax=Mobilicoccus massiliensis TaxID=1522310 RepID=UPI00058E121D|nr:TenA family protein [Mobilicoccus massiliensis]
MTRFSVRLRDANASEWDAAVCHRFVDELLAGTVDDAKLAHYLVQDYRFCDAFVAMLGQACASAPNLETRLRFARQLGFFAADENTYFVDSFDALGVSERDRVDPVLTDATRDFDRVMRDAVASRSYAGVLAVLVVAEWLYLDWATRPAADPLAATRPEHVGWVDLHRGPEFEAWVRWLREQLDAHEPRDPEEKALVEDLFARAVTCELAFFDAALEPPR